MNRVMLGLGVLLSAGLYFGLVRQPKLYKADCLLLSQYPISLEHVELRGMFVAANEQGKNILVPAEVCVLFEKDAKD